jgi:hypothetical protein
VAEAGLLVQAPSRRRRANREGLLPDKATGQRDHATTAWPGSSGRVEDWQNMPAVTGMSVLERGAARVWLVGDDGNADASAVDVDDGSVDEAGFVAG